MSQNSIIADINNVAHILKKEGICNNTHSLNNIKINRSNKCEYSVFGLNFTNIPLPRNTKFNAPSIQVSLDVVIKEKTIDKNDIDIPIIMENEKDNYIFAFKISLLNNKKMHTDCWHLDYDNKPNKSEYIHPFFHLTHGGKDMEGLDLGQTMVLLTPRFPFMPFDIILGIDFIIANFYKKDVYKKLYSYSPYRLAIQHSQNRLWKPYFQAIASHWCSIPSMKLVDDKLPTNILPYLIHDIQLENK